MSSLRQHVELVEDTRHQTLASSLRLLDGGHTHEKKTRGGSGPQRQGNWRSAPRRVLGHNFGPHTPRPDSIKSSSSSSSPSSNTLIDTKKEKKIHHDNTSENGEQKAILHRHHHHHQPRKESVLLKSEPHCDFDILSAQLDALFQKRKPSLELIEQRNEILTKLQKLLAQAGKLNTFCLKVFGSVPSNLANHKSDMDMCLVGDLTNFENKKNLDPRALVLKFWHGIIVHNKIGVSKCILAARVPVVKFEDKLYGIQCDFTASNQFDSHTLKTWLLQAYTFMDSRVSQLVDFVKLWSKRRYIGDASKGSLNSFGHTLMVIHFAQNCSSPLVPNLQEGHGPAHDYASSLELSNVNPFINSDAYQNFKPLNRQSIGELLLDFFTYYAKFSYKSWGISVRQGKFVRLPNEFTQKSQIFYEKHRMQFCIEDPFDTRDNVARNIVKKVADQIIAEFRRGKKYLESAESIDELLLAVEPKRRNARDKPERGRGRGQRNREERLRNKGVDNKADNRLQRSDLKHGFLALAHFSQRIIVVSCGDNHQLLNTHRIKSLNKC